MREINVDEISKHVCEMVQNINYHYPKDIYEGIQNSLKKETSAIGHHTLELLLKNADIATERSIPICQDTGMAVVFLKIGQDVHFVGGNLHEAIQQGIAKGYQEGYLRKSVVDDPVFERNNTKSNTPAIIYTEIVDGDKVIVEVIAKGFGSENMSVLKMLKPAQGVDGVIQTVVDAVKLAGPNACPPMVVGVGIGGTFEYATYLAKKATLRSIDSKNENEQYAALEVSLLDKINALNIGPQGLKGDTTALGVNVEYYPTHIAGLPVAVNISCHITRHAKEEI